MTPDAPLSREAPVALPDRLAREAVTHERACHVRVPGAALRDDVIRLYFSDLNIPPEAEAEYVEAFRHAIAAAIRAALDAAVTVALERAAGWEKLVPWGPNTEDRRATRASEAHAIAAAIEALKG